mgnify:CR=1 FL=1
MIPQASATEQAARVADFLEQNPASTIAAIEATCSIDPVSKLQTVMHRMPGAATTDQAQAAQ